MKVTPNEAVANDDKLLHLPPSAFVEAPLKPVDIRDARLAEGGFALTCARIDATCTPRMIAVTAFGVFASRSEDQFNSLCKNEDSSKHTIVITFDEPTSTPPLLRKEDVDRCVQEGLCLYSLFSIHSNIFPFYLLDISSSHLESETTMLVYGGTPVSLPSRSSRL